jgi:hypothetical protein
LNLDVPAIGLGRDKEHVGKGLSFSGMEEGELPGWGLKWSEEQGAGLLEVAGAVAQVDVEGE